MWVFAWELASKVQGFSMVPGFPVYGHFLLSATTCRWIEQGSSMSCSYYKIFYHDSFDFSLGMLAGQKLVINFW